MRVLPGIKRYGVAIVSRAPIAALETQLPVNAAPARFSVGTDGTRVFRNCLLASLGADPQDTTRLLYTFRCEDVTP